MNLFNAYKYLYYRIYAFQLRWFGKEDLPEYTAVLSVSLLVWWNFYAILLAISLWTRFKIVDALNPDKIKLGLGLLFIIITNSFIFIDKQNYQQIAQQFKDENNSKRRIKLIFIFAYVVISFVVPFLF